MVRLPADNIWQIAVLPAPGKEADHEEQKRALFVRATAAIGDDKRNAVAGSGHETP